GSQPGPSGPRGGINKRDRIATHLRAHRPLPERLRREGYTTVGVTPNPFTSRQFGFDTGFDRFVDFFDSSGFGGDGLRKRIVSRWADGEFVGGLRFATNMLGRGDVSVDCSTVVTQAVDAIDDAPEPFFLWLMFLDPHWPYRPPARYCEGTGLLERYRANWRASNLSNGTPSGSDADALRTLYRGTIRHTDDCLETLRDELRSYDPAYVFHSDHGEAFGEHGRYGHGGLLYEENVRVPLVVGNVGDGATVRRPISLRAIPRLVTALSAGETDVAAYTTDRTYAISEQGDICVRGPEWKYYLEADGPRRFYDLGGDPTEQAGTAVDIDGLERQYRAQLTETSELERATRDGIAVDRL
ncbi:MAG: sulfatase-like hydrolase/transferase, partial [Halapricum sp.]